MKLKTVIVIVLLGFVAVSVGYLIIKEVRSGGKAAPVAAGTLSKPAVATVTTTPALAGGTTAAPTPRTAAKVDPVAAAEADGKVVTVYWFYDNKH
jgi:hypothetical protein